MRETLTVSLPPRTKRLIVRAATESGLTTSEYVRMAIHRKLWQDAARESRRIALSRARAQGVFTAEDVFTLIVRVVFGTSVVVAGIVAEGLCRKILEIYVPEHGSSVRRAGMNSWSRCEGSSADPRRPADPGALSAALNWCDPAKLAAAVCRDQRRLGSRHRAPSDAGPSSPVMPTCRHWRAIPASKYSHRASS
jgi:hypothetical protein